MKFLRFVSLVIMILAYSSATAQTTDEMKIVVDLFRLRNEHKADSAALFFADTVKVYMKYLRNVSPKEIAKSDRQFWKKYSRYRFEITSPLQIKRSSGYTSVVLYGKDFLNGDSFVKERVEIRLNRRSKIFYFRAVLVK